MQKQFLVSLFFLCFVAGNAQQYNLVPNPSFEQYTNCPYVPNAIPPPPWFTPGKKIGTYLNVCGDITNGIPFNYIGTLSFQYPRTGNAYIFLDYLNGIGNNARTYVQVPLKDSLVAGKCYYGEYYINLPNPLKIGCNNIAMLFTKNKVYVDTIATPFGVLPANPQIVNHGNPILGDTLNWIKVSGVFVAQGGEKYLSLGNFKYDNETSFAAIQATGQNKVGYYIDDVSVYPLDSINLKADAGVDKNITLGDSAFIGSYTNGLTGVRWFNNLGQEIVNRAGIPGFFVKPTTSTFYVIEQNVCGQYSRDTVNVNVNPMPLRFTIYHVRFANSSSLLQSTKQSVENAWQTSNEIHVSHFNIQRSQNGVDFETIGTVKAKNNIFNEYSFSDHSLPSTVDCRLYYRVLALDFDGKKTYSTTQQITVNHLNDKPVTVYPNPAKDHINIQSKEKITEVRLYNLFGQLIKHQPTAYATNPLLIKINEAKGTYLLRVVTIKGEEYNQKIILQ